MEVPDSLEAEIPCIQGREVSCDLAEGVHQDQRQGEDSCRYEAAGGSSYYVVEAVPLVQGGSLSSGAEAGHRVQAGDSSRSEAEAPVLVGCSYYGEGLALG
jgi:hypothetical protein